MKFLSNIALTIAGSLALVTAAQAVPIQTAIGLSIDGSGSISSSNFALQRDAYAGVLGDGSILPADGSVVIYVNQFSSSVQTEVAALRINDEADRTSLIDGINAMAQLNSSTNIGGGILDAADALDSFLGGFDVSDFAPDFRALIDVSTDGFHNTGPEPDTASSDVLAGVGLANVTFDQVNCLGVGSSADCSWIQGSSFSLNADSFADFESVLQTKLGREIGTDPSEVPEPVSLGLLSVGLVAMGVMRRRRRV